MLGLTTAAPDGAAAPEHAGDIDPWRTEKHFYFVAAVDRYPHGSLEVYVTTGN